MRLITAMQAMKRQDPTGKLWSRTDFPTESAEVIWICRISCISLFPIQNFNGQILPNIFDSLSDWIFKIVFFKNINLQKMMFNHVNASLCMNPSIRKISVFTSSDSRLQRRLDVQRVKMISYLSAFLHPTTNLTDIDLGDIHNVKEAFWWNVTQYWWPTTIVYQTC